MAVRSTRAHCSVWATERQSAPLGGWQGWRLKSRLGGGLRAAAKPARAGSDPEFATQSPQADFGLQADQARL